VLQRWQKAGFRVYAPATLEELAIAEQRLSWAFSPPMRDFYSVANGAEGFSPDCVRILPLHDLEIRDAGGVRCLQFAEWMLDSAEYGLRSDDHSVVLLMGKKTQPIFPDFESFLAYCASMDGPPT
jgi:hypothetical protein